MGQKIYAQDAMKEVRKWFKTQIILQSDMDLGIFAGICGIPDAIYVDEAKKTAIIMDLKTAKTIDPVKYHWHCLTYNYYRQMAVYNLLVKANYNVEKITSQHLVLEKDGDGVYNCQTFILNPDRIQQEIGNVFNILEAIKNETKYLPNNTRWQDAIEIGGQKDKDEEVEI